ncbi:anti-sigma factor [Corynebacterium diphtheriae]|uniref:anti-sigma factor n=1 Tax=Corynebacterium diphtheriae TaxID=1717 RepID=UPI000B4BCB4A|nr:anti-sigma factor [Corynebacterium diphtheriae]MBG9227112.1 anti-sigma factor [Corynebacterium diphtheriae bv. gravis]MBG9250122.1 anti-sigma factor [Corynebacterium diphtheriae bv. mitis]MBG9254792.1 anti-sigma factor [Corynebacterium diphtheriae bv. mitis]MBG9261091.1 anti-sigma factor [Corynebacterium diphtheriae bv. mitis]MBG9267749.1 anti-sigma factor [Corynebacterium diphtheriae bv. mitis]
MSNNFPRDIEDALNVSPAPLTPPPALKLSVMDAIAATPQEQLATVTPLRRRRPGLVFASMAASVVLLAGAVTAVYQPWQAADPHAQMDSILAASDVRQAGTSAMGATLDIVVSQSMNSGGAMVDGAPAVGHGMGAQVWAVKTDGSMESAGVIGPEEHTDVWMPLPGDTHKVMITEEPMAGSTSPRGKVLAEVVV